jgi:hypothetical protein
MKGNMFKLPINMYNYKEQFKKNMICIHVYILILLIFFLQVLLWINQSFLLQDDLSCEGNLNVAFMSLRGSGPLIIQMETKNINDFSLLIKK